MQQYTQFYFDLALTGAKLRTPECRETQIKCCSARNQMPIPKTLLIAPFVLLALCCCQMRKHCCVSVLVRIGIPHSPKGMWSSLC